METGMWKRKLEAVEAEALEERSWKRKQTRKRLTLYGGGSGSKKYSTASTSLHGNAVIATKGRPSENTPYMMKHH